MKRRNFILSAVAGLTGGTLLVASREPAAQAEEVITHSSTEPIVFSSWNLSKEETQFLKDTYKAHQRFVLRDVESDKAFICKIKANRINVRRILVDS